MNKPYWKMFTLYVYMSIVFFWFVVILVEFTTDWEIKVICLIVTPPSLLIFDTSEVIKLLIKNNCVSWSSSSSSYQNIPRSWTLLLQPHRIIVKKSLINKVIWIVMRISRYKCVTGLCYFEKWKTNYNITTNVGFKL